MTAKLTANRQMAIAIGRRTPNLSISRPTNGSVIAESSAHSAMAAPSDARLQPNSLSNGPMKTPNANTLIGPLPTIRPNAPPSGTSQSRAVPSAPRFRSIELDSMTISSVLVLVLCRVHDTITQSTQAAAGLEVRQRRADEIAVAKERPALGHLGAQSVPTGFVGQQMRADDFHHRGRDRTGHAARCACQQQIARAHVEDRGHVVERLDRLPDQLLRRRFLPQLAVDAQAQLQPIQRRRDLGRLQEPQGRPQRAEGAIALAAKPLQQRLAELDVARRHVVAEDHAGHVLADVVAADAIV